MFIILKNESCKSIIVTLITHKYKCYKNELLCWSYVCDICIFKLCKYTCLFCNQLMKLNSMYKNKMHENVEFNSLLNSAFYHIHPQSRTYESSCGFLSTL